jgi:hypothetical protein
MSSPFSHANGWMIRQAEWDEDQYQQERQHDDAEHPDSRVPVATLPGDPFFQFFNCGQARGRSLKQRRRQHSFDIHSVSCLLIHGSSSGSVRDPQLLDSIAGLGDVSLPRDSMMRRRQKRP